MKQALKNKFSTRLLPLSLAALMIASTVGFQPVQAESTAQVIKCAAIDAFATVSAKSLKDGQARTEATFTLSLQVMQDAWKLQDMTTAAQRQVSVNAFMAVSTAFANTKGLSTVRKSAILTYQDLLVKSVNTLETNVDAAEAAYREDMLALANAHQATLRVLLQAQVDAINGAAATAKQNCTQNGVTITLIGAVSTANTVFTVKALALDVQSLQKATDIVTTRNDIFNQQDKQFFDIATAASFKLTKVMLTGKN